MSAVATPDSAAFLSQLQPGQKLAGCYLLQKPIATRGARAIWLAHDEVLGKDVALHFLPVEILSRSGVAERLRQEVKRNRQLIHPSILRVYDFIEEDEWAAISTDAFDGATLGARLAERDGGVFGVAEIAPWLTALGSTLEDAHRIRLVHGALTPDDVVLGEGGKMRVMNFGIGAALRDAEEKPASAAFASPQQLAGEKPVASDDIFALGAITHTLLAGEPPFAGTKRGEARTVALHRRALKRKGADVPAGWQQAISAALAAEASARPASVAEFLQKTQSESAPEPVVEKPAAEVEVKAAPVIEEKVETPAPAPTPTPEKVVEVTSEVIPPPVVDVEVVAKTEPKPEAKAKDEEPPKKTPVLAPVDAETLAETVRREEAAEEARTYRYANDDEDEYAGSRSSGGRGMALPIIGSAVGLLIIFAVVKLLVGDPKRPVPTSTSTPVPAVAKNESTPAVVKPASESGKTVSVPSDTKPAPASATPIATAPAPAPVVTETKSATPAPQPAKEPIAEKSPAVLAAEEAEAATKKQQELETKIAAQKKELDEKTKALPAMQKAATEAAAQEKKREEEALKAEQAAQLAIQAAEDKKKTAEAARQAVTTLTEQGKAKKDEHTKTVELVSNLQKTVQDDEKALADARKAALEAVKRREAEAKKMLDAESAKTAQAAVEKAEADRKAKEMAEAQRKEKEAADAKAKEEAMTQAREAEKPKVQDELAKAREQFQKQAEALENAIKSAKPAATPAPVKAETPVPPTDSTLRLDDPAMVKTESQGIGDLAMKKNPEPSPALPKAGASGEFMNSLGMKFVPLGGSDTLVAIWPTRVRDFEVFAKTTGLKSTLWKDPGFKQGSDHPVVNVTWQEASAFCKWLTVKERAEGLLAPSQSYRLPTDLEWSRAAGLPAENGGTPEQRDMGVPDVYPWGSAWPPPANAGNYTGEETGSDVAIKGYDDGFPWTSPVGSFPPNKQGLYDMGGNVWQWCQDSWNNESKAKVLRGASWYNGALKLSLLSSCRVHAAPDSGTDNYGFRVIIAPDSGKSPKR